MFSNFDFDVIRRSLGYLFLDGMTFTLTLTGLSAVGGLVFGTLLALMRLSGLKLLGRIAGLYVDSGYFHALGVHPFAGRFFDPTEAEPGANYAVAVASHDYWRRELGEANLSTLAPVRIGDNVFRVIGVAPSPENRRRAHRLSGQLLP